MESLKLVIGDKTLSSWSMRAWLAIKQTGLPFEETKILLDRPQTKDLLKENSPSEKVPCLIHADLRIWDSLAICEYLAELAPQSMLWPHDPARRAIARSYVAEMHSGFQSLRSQCSMDLSLKMRIRHLSPDTISDIKRILQLWETALDKSNGPFLFGSYGIADAFFTPVVFRFLCYGIKITSQPGQEYMKAVQDFPIVKAWVDEAKKEEPYATVF